LRFLGAGRKGKILVICGVALLVFSSLVILIVFPTIQSPQEKPVILYYNYENLPFNTSEFPTIVSTTLQHNFNTLMLLVYYDNRMIFNDSTLQYFYSYAKSRNLSFVPSYYVESLGDNINVTEFPRVNLDMERIAPNRQPYYYAKIEDEGSGRTISVTSPYGQPVEFEPSLDIVETYAGTPWFWFLQLGYWHPSHICSIAPFLLYSQQEYDSEKQYCLKYTGGFMVFDYYNLLRSHLN